MKLQQRNARFFINEIGYSISIGYFIQLSRLTTNGSTMVIELYQRGNNSISIKCKNIVLYLFLEGSETRRKMCPGVKSI